jgi:hypothetical protein
MNEAAVKTPVHLWIIGLLALLWDAMGAFDYAATQLRLEFYMSQFTAEQLEYFYAFPVWVEAAWAIAVWSSLLAAIGLLLRKAWAVMLFGLAILGLAVTSVYNLVLTEGLAIMGEGAGAFTAAIWIIALALFFYARAMARSGVLR